MPDTEKVIKGLERCKLYNKLNCDKCPYDYNGRGNGKSECTAELATDALALLKEQKKQRFFVDSDGKITPLPDVVRCKDCKHKGISYECILDRDLEEYGSHRTQEYDNWYCADGERKEEEP